MKMIAVMVTAGAALVLWSAPVLAHHSFAAQYDATRHVELKGVVTKVEWTNPHARFYIDEKNDRGDVTSWNFEMASRNVLVRNGWKRTSLKIGDELVYRDSHHLSLRGSERVAGVFLRWLVSH